MLFLHSSSSSGLSMDWICFTFISGVYFTTRNVSYGQGSLLAWVSNDSLLWNGTESMARVTRGRGTFILFLIREYCCSSEQALRSLVSSPGF